MRKIYLLALIAFAFASFGAMPMPPSGWEGCVVAGYSETTGSVSSVRKAASAKTVANTLLPASAPATSAAAAPIERKWVLRSAGGTNAQYVVKMTMQSSGEISMCAYSPNRVIVTLQKGKSYAEFVSQMEANGFTVVRKLMTDTSGNPVYIVKAADTETDLVESMTMGIQATGCCSMIKPDHIFTAGATPKDAKFSQQWGLVKIGAPTAWNTRTDASSVLVAVLDTGVNYNHMDLSGSMWINSGESAMPGNGTDDDANDIVDDLHGMECISGGNISGNPVDDNGHGSHCAGIIGAVSDRYGVCGVAWKANIMGLKFLNSEGKGYVSDAITCLQYATDKGVKIVNCSFGATDWDDYFYEQIKIMAAKGIILVCAAGNAENGEPARDNDEYPFYPCNYPVSNIVSVAATDENDNLANFSYFGANNVDIAAPGVNIYSTIHSGTAAYDYMDGTSMATPHVTGALALLMAEYPDESPYSIVERLYAAGADIAALAGKVRTGRRLDLANFFGLPAPVDITASQGDVADAVALYWANVAGALYYRVWRAETEGGEKTALSPWQTGLTFTDSTAEPGVTYYYYVQSAATETGGSASAYSSAVPGHRPELSSEEHVTVSFKPQGGSVASESSDYVVGKTYGTFPAAVYDGKVFLGWYTESIQGSRIDATQSARADLTELYAHWIDENEPRILNLFARQRYPWNGYVDVSFDLAGVAENHVADVSMIADNGVDDQEVALSSWVGNGPTNLTNGAHAFVWDSASDASGILYTNMTLDATVSVRSLRPDAPTNVSASDGISSEAVLVSWNAVDTATSYDVYRYDSDCSVGAIGSLATKLGNVSTTNFTDNTAVAGLGYFYWIKAINSSGESDFSSSDRGYRKKVVESISIGGEATIIAGDSASLTCLATYNDKQNSVVVPTWSIYSGSGYLSIDTAGNITAQKVSSAGQAVVQASYTYGGITKVERKTISVTTRTVTITFDGNGGTPSFASKSYTSYGMFVTLPTGSREGYTLSGWYTAATGGSWIMAATSVPEVATTYYAHWTKTSYTVTLDQQGGAGGTASVAATFDNAMPTVEIPSRSGYTFGGYFTETAGGGTQYYTASGTSARNWDKTSATTLYAKWSALSMMVTLDRQGGSGGTSSVTATFGSAMPSVIIPSRTGYMFGGYFSETNGGGMQYYLPDGSSARVCDKTGSVVLYAKWTAIAPSVPSGVAATDGMYSDKVLVSWTSVAGATSYSVWRSTSPSVASATQIAVVSGTDYSDATAVGGTKYYYWVKAENGVGVSGWSVSDSGFRACELTGLVIEGPKSFPTDCQGAYKMYATYSDGHRVDVTEGVACSIPANDYATMASTCYSDSDYGKYRLLKAKTVTTSTQLVITASYEENSKFVTADFTVSISATNNSSYRYHLWPDGTCWLTAYLGDKTLPTIYVPSSIDGATVTGNMSLIFGSDTLSASIILPSTFKRIGDELFYGCPNLKNISIPTSVQSVGYHSFANLSSLQTLSLPESVTKIEGGAFYWSVSLAKISIPSTTSFIAYDSFYGCTNLEEIVVNAANPYFKSIDGVLFNYEGSDLLKCPSKKSGKYTVPSSVKRICAMAFSDSCVSELVIPASVIEIGETDFPQSRMNYGQQWRPLNFAIGRYHTKITVAEDNPVFSSRNGALYNKNKSILYAYPAKGTARYYCMPDSVRESYVSDGGEDLKFMTYSDSLVSVGCGDGRGSGVYGFYAKNVDRQMIPNTVNIIYELNASSLEYLCIPATVTNFCISGSRLYRFGDYPAESYVNTTTYAFPELFGPTKQTVTWNNPIWGLSIVGEDKVFAGQKTRLFAEGYFESGHFGIASKADWFVAEGSAYVTVNPANGEIVAKGDVTKPECVSVYATTTLGGSYVSAERHTIQVVPANTNKTVLAFGNYAYNRLRWLPVAKAEKYKIRRGTSTSYASAAVIDTHRKDTYNNTETYVDSSAMLGVTYYYWIEALDGNDKSINVSDVCSATRKVGDLSLVQGMILKMDNLTSDPVVCEEKSEQSIIDEIEYWRGFNSTWVDYIRTGSLSSIYDANEMFWRSMYSLNKYIGIVQSRLPHSPTIMRVDATSSSSATLKWHAILGATSYQIYRGTTSNSSSATRIATVSDTSYTDISSHVVGTTYYYWIRAITPAGTTLFGTPYSWLCKPAYLIVDLSAGASASTYQTDSLWSAPSTGWSTEYKTTKLVLRLIPAGTFTMGSPTDESGRKDDEVQHSVTISKPLYIGVFPITQNQYYLVMGNNPSYYVGNARPVENVNYNLIRGGSEGAKWPQSRNVDSSSFMGKIRARTNYSFDLPTEAQWEYACRAGTTTALNSGKDLTEKNIALLGRVRNNAQYGAFDGKGGYPEHTTVGLYQANNWGIYDMHGNVSEWCLDWYSTLGNSNVTDPVGPESGTGRSSRGGDWLEYSSSCRSASRGYMYPSSSDSTRGFRLCCPLEQ